MIKPSYVKKCAGLLALAAFGLTGLPAHAQLLSNGDFESADGIFNSWTFNAGATPATEAISGDRSARLALNSGNAGNALNQLLNDPANSLSRYLVSFDFATSNPGGTANRSLQLSLRTVAGLEGGNINLRIVNGTEPGLGSVQVFQGAWNLALANVVNFSSSETGLDFNLNSISIAGNYSAAPFYSITVNGNTSADLSFFQTSVPAVGATLKQISFQSGNLITGAWSVVDNITVTAVPEPGVGSLIGLGLAGLFVARRREQ